MFPQLWWPASPCASRHHCRSHRKGCVAPQWQCWPERYRRCSVACSSASLRECQCATMGSNCLFHSPPYERGCAMGWDACLSCSTWYCGWQAAWGSSEPERILSGFHWRWGSPSKRLLSTLNIDHRSCPITNKNCVLLCRSNCVCYHESGFS